MGGELMALRAALLAVFLLAAPWAAAQEIGELKFDFGLKMQIRGLSLNNGTLVRMLDPAARQVLQSTGKDKIDESQNYMDMRARPLFRVTALDVIRVETQLEVGDVTFGAGDGGRLGTDGRVIEVKHLFLDFDVPYVGDWVDADFTLSLRGGLFGTATPDGLLLDHDHAGLALRLVAPPLGSTFTITWIKAVEASRLDLDGDGLIDNDYNDRDIALVDWRSSFSGLTLGAYFAADLDNTRDTPLSDIERDFFWAGVHGTGRWGLFGLDGHAVYNWGKADGAASDGRSVRTSAWAGLLRLRLNLEFMELRALFAAATGNDPDRAHRDDSFQTISPYFAPTNILFGSPGGFNLRDSNLSGSAVGTLEVATGFDKFSATLRGAYARLTAAPDTSANVFVSGSSRDLGWEINLNLSYQLYEPLTLFCNSGVLLPGKGTRLLFDSPSHDPIWEVVFGLRLSL